MFTIDLLKGQGVPIKSRPRGVAIGVAAIAVPLIIAIIMLSVYLRNKIIISIENRGIASYKTKTDKLSDAIKLHKSLQKEKNLYSNCLFELESSVRKPIQWSPVLATVVKNMPDQVVLTGLEVKRRFIKRKIPKKGEPKKQVDISVPVSTLTMSVAVVPQPDCDQAVRDFRHRLLHSDFLRGKLENINVSQDSGTLDGQEVVSYQIDCLFKPAL